MRPAKVLIGQWSISWFSEYIHHAPIFAKYRVNDRVLLPVVDNTYGSRVVIDTGALAGDDCPGNPNACDRLDSAPVSTEDQTLYINHTLPGLIKQR